MRASPRTNAAAFQVAAALAPIDPDQTEQESLHSALNLVSGLLNTCLERGASVVASPPLEGASASDYLRSSSDRSTSVLLPVIAAFVSGVLVTLLGGWTSRRWRRGSKVWRVTGVPTTRTGNVELVVDHEASRPATRPPPHPDDDTHCVVRATRVSTSKCAGSGGSFDEPVAVAKKMDEPTYAHPLAASNALEESSQRRQSIGDRFAAALGAGERSSGARHSYGEFRGSIREEGEVLVASRC